MSDANLFTRQASMKALEQFTTKEQMADLFCELTEELFAKCEELTQKDARIRELEEREKKLVDMIRKYCVCSSMYSSAGDCSFCTNLKELGINNE